jgi:hypothetical protein
MEMNKEKNKDNDNNIIRKIDLDNKNDRNSMIKTVKNIINANNNNIYPKRVIDIKESYEKNKEDENINNADKDNAENNNIIPIIKEENVKSNNQVEEEKNNEDPILSHMNSNNIYIDDEEIHNSSKIILEDINGDLFNGQKIEINAAGMVGGRNKRDGFSIFGQKNINRTKKLDEDNDVENSKQKNDNEPKIDFELNYAQFLAYPYIFSIYYKKENKSYYIKAFSGKGSDSKILFIKLNNKNKFILNQRELLLTGNAIFQLTAKGNFLELINFSKNTYNDDRYVVDGFNKKRITIGRHRDCDFSFPKDKSFSRYQTTIEFNEIDKQWSIIDGNNEKGSTNGTWLFGTHSFLIQDEMIVEILNNQIKITEIKASNCS